MHPLSVDSPLTAPASAGRTVRAYIGLGSNLDKPAVRLSRAFDALDAMPESRVLARSSLYRSRPLGDLDQPDYLNAVAVVETALDAASLLTRLQEIETQQGRMRTGQRWSSRVLDLDLLVFGNERHRNPLLTVPHPGLTERDFVLFPLHEVEPGLEIPGIGPLQDCLAACPVRGIERLIPGDAADD